MSLPLAASLPDDRLQLLAGDITELCNPLSIHLDGGKLQRKKPLDDARVRLLDDVNIERILFPQFCYRRTDVLSYSAGRVVEVEPDQHGSPPTSSLTTVSLRSAYIDCVN
jgi:hypothetical protein